MNDIKLIGSQLVSGGIGVELIFPVGTRKVYFPDLAVLRGKRVKHIDLCNELSVTPRGNAIYDNDAYITLKDNASVNYSVSNMPASQLRTSYRKGNRLCFDHVFDFSKSYVTISETLTTAKSMFFVVWYDEPGVKSLIDPRKKRFIDSFEIKLSASNNQFKENRTLAKKKYQAILLSYPTLTAENNDSITSTTAKKSYITLQKGNLQFIQNVPVYLFYQTQNYYMLNFENVSFDFTNSFIKIINPLSTDFKSVFFNCIVEA